MGRRTESSEETGRKTRRAARKENPPPQLPRTVGSEAAGAVHAPALALGEFGDVPSGDARADGGAPPRKGYSIVPDATEHGSITVHLDRRSENLQRVRVTIPRLVQVTGTITSVGFEPGTSFVGLKIGSRSIRCAATTQQVEGALPLRTGTVTAAILDGEKPTLIWIRSAAMPHMVPSLAETIQHLHTDWRNTLTELAR